MRGGSWIGGLCSLNIFLDLVNCLVNIESRQDNHNKRLFEYFFISRQILLGPLICHRLFQKKAKLRVLNFVWPLKRGNDNRELSHGDDQKLAAAA